MPILRAVKCAPIEEQLKAALKVAEKAKIEAVEIQQLIGDMNERSTYDRMKTVVNHLDDFYIKGLVYHYPFPDRLYNSSDIEDYDVAGSLNGKILRMTMETMREAAEVGHELGLDSVIVDIHLFGMVDGEVTEEIRKEKLTMGEFNLLDLNETAKEYSEKYGCEIILTRENNPPDHGYLPGVLDFAPQDVMRTVDKGIDVCLDFAHLGQYVDYILKGNGELPGADLSRRIYGDVTVEGTIDMVGEYIKLIHINDFQGFGNRFEGMEVGQGIFPHEIAIPLICRKADSPIGTYEIKDGHKDPESMLRSDQKYREIFGKDFDKYFE